jgi:hypothetical protein
VLFFESSAGDEHRRTCCKTLVTRWCQFGLMVSMLIHQSHDCNHHVTTNCALTSLTNLDRHSRFGSSTARTTVCSFSMFSSFQLAGLLACFTCKIVCSIVGISLHGFFIWHVASMLRCSVLSLILFNCFLAFVPFCRVLHIHVQFCHLSLLLSWQTCLILRWMTLWP